MKKYQRILLVNDDGYLSKGISILEKAARELAEEVWIVAPSSDRSGAGNSFSFREPIKVEQISQYKFAVFGTPSDCVALALETIMKDNQPDLILSGINSGSNLGFETVVSGTVGAAMTGALMGVRSIALSQYKLMEDSVDWSVSEALCLEVLQTVLSWPDTEGSCLNINFPNIAVDDVNGIKIGIQGVGKVGGINVTKVNDPLGDTFYWLRVRHSRNETITDSELNLILDGYVSVTPLGLDRTHLDNKCHYDFHNK